MQSCITSTSYSNGNTPDIYTLQRDTDRCATYETVGSGNVLLFGADSELVLPQANLLYASGGKFYILTPHSKRVESVLHSFRASVEEGLLHKFEGSVGFVMGSTMMCGQDYIGSKESDQPHPITRKWDEVTTAAERAKLQPFLTQISANQDFFEPTGPRGHVVSCHATGRYLCGVDEAERALADERIFRHEQDDDTNHRFISPEQYRARALGKRLKRVELLVRSSEGGNDAFDLLGAQRLFLYPQASEVRQVSGRAVLLNDDTFLEKIPASRNLQRGWQFYGGNWTVDADFDELATRSTGVPYLGVLRMDVDNLGIVFKMGLGRHATFSRVVQLSTMLDFFFSSYLNCLSDLRWSAEDGVNNETGRPLKEMLQIVYAGGDDLFIVGAWNVMPDVALWIREAFERFTAGNPDLTLSAGISIFHRKHPLYHAARAAGDAEDLAKRFTRAIDADGTKERTVSKNAVTFLDTTMSWHDLEQLRQIMRWMYEGIAERELSRGLLYRLERIHGEYQMGKGERWAPWRWKASYSLARFGRENKGYETDIRHLAAALFTRSDTEQDLAALIHIPARWADLLTRKEES